MPRTAVPTPLRADKALVRHVAEFDESLETAEDFIELMRSSANGQAQQGVATLRKRMKAALESSDAKEAAKAVAALAKEARKCADAASETMAREVYERYVALWTRARGLLAQALVQVGALEPAALRLPLQKEQAELRACLNLIEREPHKGLASVSDLQALMPRIEALLKRLERVGTAGQWMRTSYLPLVAQVNAAVRKLPAERCRRTLLAEMDFVQVDANKALSKADVKALQTRAMPQLQRIEKVAAQISAASPALDRELGRLAQRITAASPAAKRLKGLLDAKANTWPAGADLDGIVSAMAAFDAELARLHAELAAPSDRPAAKV